MIRRATYRAVASAALALFSLAPAHAAGPQDDVIRAELLPGWETASGTQMAGLRLQLAPGWKTYWRAPGDAGIPPGFDWSASGNMAEVDIHWPTPKVFYQNGMRAIGYEHEVVLPLELTPERADSPIRLRGTVQLGVCQDICMPMQLQVRADLPATPRPAPIRAALADMPRPAAAAGVGRVTCTVDPIADGLRLTARIDMPSLGPGEVAVFELPDRAIWISEAEVSRNSGQLVAAADMVPENAAPFALDRSTVRITVLGAGGAVDIRGCPGR